LQFVTWPTPKHHIFHPLGAADPTLRTYALAEGSGEHIRVWTLSRSLFSRRLWRNVLHRMNLFVTENTMKHTNAKFRNAVISVRWWTQQNSKNTAHK